MRLLASPHIAPLYRPTQARSDCSVSHSPCVIALELSAGAWIGGAIDVVATGFGLPNVAGAVICAWAEASIATNIKVAVSNDLMTNRKLH